MGNPLVEISYFPASDFRVSPDDYLGVGVLREPDKVFDGVFVTVTDKGGGGHLFYLL